jgi:hypothetical protein
MAQAAAMGPPLSPRETRRSGRRSAHSTSTSASKSPDSPTEEARTSARPSLTTSNSSGRSKRFKQEDLEHSVEEHEKSATVTAPNGTAHGNGNGRTKRKGKEKPLNDSSTDTAAKSSGGPSRDLSLGDAAEEEEQGITRCVCGSTGASASVLKSRSGLITLQRTIPMLASSWSNARRVVPGSMDCVWDMNRRISYLMTTTTANNVDQIYTTMFSSTSIDYRNMPSVI